MKDLQVTKRFHTPMSFFSKFHCTFLKSLNFQYCLVTVIVKWWRSVDRGFQARALLTWEIFQNVLIVLTTNYQKQSSINTVLINISYYSFIFEQTKTKQKNNSALDKIADADKKSLFWHFPYYPLTRISRPEVFRREGVVGNFAKFTGKHLCQGLFFNKVEQLSYRTPLVAAWF